ncbi:MAG: hypothetical protein CMK24_08335 [Porticoccaceae bacterium]|nr:hypothetical protein [Porticoccaceae bacterium]
MSTIKVDEIFGDQPTDAVDLPNKLKVGGASVEQGYTASGSEPSSPSNGDYWWDTGNNKLYKYMDGGFKELGVAAGSFFGTRGVIAAGYGTQANGYGADTIQYITITSPGNATDFGDLTRRMYYNASHSDGSRMLVAGGRTSSSYQNSIEYLTIGTTGNGTDFGDMTEARGILAGGGDATRSLFAGGQGQTNTGAPSNRNESRTIDYVTTGTAGNATDFGDLSYFRDYLTATADLTRTVIGGGEDYSGGGNSAVTTMDYVTTQTTGNAADFGDLTKARYALNSGVIANSVRGIFTSGYGTTYENIIDYITIQTAGNATDFGDTLQGLLDPATCSDGTTGIIAGGSRGGSGSQDDNTIQKITIDTAGNATDFGNLNAIDGQDSFNKNNTAASGT